MINNTTKPIIFISHIDQEKQIALALKKLIEDAFFEKVDTFVSSDGKSIKMGQKWLDEITKALRNCSIEIIICSKESIKRPWINFEAGAAWLRDIPVIPICHSGMEPSKLPVPLNLLRAAKASETLSLKQIFTVIAQALGAEIPNVNLSKFIQDVKAFEKKEPFWEKCNESFGKLNAFGDHIISDLKKGKEVIIGLTESDTKIFEDFMPFLSENSILSYSPTKGGTFGGLQGTTSNYLIKPLKRLNSIVNNPSFEIQSYWQKVYDKLIKI